MAVVAVISERVSVGIFPVKQENTGKLRRSSRKGGKRLGFPTISQLVTPKFPTHLNREFSGANRELFPVEQGRSRS